MKEIERYFRPEFIGRLDDVIVFRPLSRANLEQIVEFELKKVTKRLVEHGLKIEITAGSQGVPDREGHQRRLRRPPAASRDRAARGRPAQRGNPPRRLQRQGPDQDHGQGRGREATSTCSSRPSPAAARARRPSNWPRRRRTRREGLKRRNVKRNEDARIDRSGRPSFRPRGGKLCGRPHMPATARGRFG